RSVINRCIYTIQQAIGFALDGLPAKQTNTARKLNGDYFEKLILLIFQEIGVDASNGVVRVPVQMEEEEVFKMNYQHDLIVKNADDEVSGLGSVKTTSKDRIDKIFIDKFLDSKLTETQLAHIAIFFHDVKRKTTKRENFFSINGTFLSGRFKGYTIKLNPLDGVYYFDPRTNMQVDAFLSQHIHTFDHLLCEDIWNYLEEE